MTNTLDPRSRLVVVFVFSSLAVLIQDLNLYLGLLFCVVLAVYFLGGDWGVIRRLGRLIKTFLALILIQSIFTRGGVVLVQIGNFPLLTSIGLERGLALFFRFAIILLSSSILLSVNPRQMVQGFIQWKIPYEIAFMVQLAIRFLPLLQEELGDVLTALQLRGVELERIPWGQRLRIYSYLFMPVLAGVISKAREISTAMEMRGFRASPQRTTYLELYFTTKDYFVMLLSGLLFGTFLLLQISL